MCPDWEWNWWPFGLQPAVNPLSYTSQGLIVKFERVLWADWHRFGSLKLAVIGVLTPKQLANTTNQGCFLLFREHNVKHSLSLCLVLYHTKPILSPAIFGKHRKCSACSWSPCYLDSSNVSEFFFHTLCTWTFQINSTVSPAPYLNNLAASTELWASSEQVFIFVNWFLAQCLAYSNN